MKLKFLGTTASTPDVGEDSPCFLVNERYLFDCGWYAAGGLRETDCAAQKVRYVIFTHMHHDHYLGLPSLLFYFIHNKLMPLGELTIVGPAGDVERVVGLAFELLQLDRFYPTIGRPQVVGLEPGEKLETADMLIESAKSVHPVDGLCYKLTDKTDGCRLAASGDTTYAPHLPPFFAGCDAIVHEATLGLSPKNTPASQRCGHSNIFEALRTAEEAGIPTLYPVHMSVENAKRTCASVTSEKVEIIRPVRGAEYTV